MKVKFLILICILFFQWNDDEEGGGDGGNGNRSGGGGGRGRLLMMVSARYLPTRAHTDNMDRLRELIEDILKSDPETTIAIANNLVQQGNNNNNNPSSIDQIPSNDNNNNRDYDRSNGGGRGNANIITGRNPLFGSIHRNPNEQNPLQAAHKIGRNNNNYYYYIGGPPPAQSQAVQMAATGREMAAPSNDRYLLGLNIDDNFDYDRRNQMSGAGNPNNNNNNNGIAYGYQRFVFKRDLENDKISTENGRYPPMMDDDDNHDMNEINKKITKQNDNHNNYPNNHPNNHPNHYDYNHHRQLLPAHYSDKSSESRNVRLNPDGKQQQQQQQQQPN